MDLDLIKQKLAQAQAPKEKKKFEKIDYTKIFWKPKVGKTQIRVVPSKRDKQNPFLEVYLHYGFTNFPLVALTTYGEKDPIDEFAKAQFKSADKEDWELGKKIKPKQRVFIPVIVRGEEEKGVRLWEFGKEVYTQLLSIAADEDYGDFTDVVEGHDFTVEGVEDSSFGKTYIKAKILVKPKKTSLSDNADDVKRFLEEQPDFFAINPKRSFDEIKGYLQKWLDVDSDEGEIDVIPDAVAPDDNDVPVVVTTKKTGAKAKASNADKFDSLFES